MQNCSKVARHIVRTGSHHMDLQLKNKTALVTGGSEGIAKGTGRKIVAIPADLTKDADARNFIEKGHATLGRVDIMINNAGSSPGGVIEHLSEDDWAQSLQLKFMGYVRCLRY